MRVGFRVLLVISVICGVAFSAGWELAIFDWCLQLMFQFLKICLMSRVMLYELWLPSPVMSLNYQINSLATCCWIDKPGSNLLCFLFPLSCRPPTVVIKFFSIIFYNFQINVSIAESLIAWSEFFLSLVKCTSWMLSFFFSPAKRKYWNSNLTDILLQRDKTQHYVYQRNSRVFT